MISARYFRFVTVCLMAGLLGQARADETVKLDAVVTHAGRGPDDPVVFSGLAGLETDALHFPRDATRIGEGELQALRVTHVEELAPFIAGASDAPPYGLTGVPWLRGELGDAAQNGQRKAFNRNVFPVSFNSVEAVEAVAGAAPVFLGYTNGSGGMVNFITKRPEFGPELVRVSTTYGSWNERRAQLDVSREVAPNLAARLSVERVDNGSFYRLAHEESWDVYLALAWRPAKTVRWDFSGEAYHADYVENPGTNRPTQALIDRGEYITGSSVQNGGTGPYFGNTFTPTGTIRLDGSQVLLAPGDGATARVYTAQLTGAWETGAGHVVNRTYFESVDSEKSAAYRFYSLVPVSYTLENRTELNGATELAGRRHTWLAGLAVRGEKRESYVDFFNEAINAFDLTLDPESFRLPRSAARFLQPVPGRAGAYAVPGGRYGSPASVGLSQTLRSWLGNAGVFAQDEISLTRSLAMQLAARADGISVKAEDPMPLPGYAPVRDHLAKFLPAGSASLTWSPAPEVAVYGTAQQARAVESSSSSGGFGLTGNRLPAVLFENQSRLFELGVKGANAKSRLTWSADIYHQHRQRTNARFGLPDEILVRGFESQAAWRVSEALSVSGNFALLDAHYLNGPLPGGIATAPQFSPSGPSDNSPSYAPGNYRLPGQPRWIAHFQAAYLRPQGWGLRVWGTLQGEQNLDLFGLVRIPPQQTWSTTLVYRIRNWEISGDCLNLTDAFNWRATSSPFAGGDLVTRELPRHWRVVVRYGY